MGRRKRRLCHRSLSPRQPVPAILPPPVGERLQGAALPWELFLLLLSIYAVLAVLLGLCFRLPQHVLQALWAMDGVICIIFLGDFLVKLLLAEDRLRFLRLHWLDLVSAIPAIGDFKYQRLLRILRILRVVSIFRDLARTRQFLRNLAANRAHWGFLAVMGCGLGIFIVASIAIVSFEEGGNGSIRTAGDAMWWSLSTLTTVGYGDMVPVTNGGRLVGFFLMTCGVAVFSSVTAYVSTFLRPAEHESAHHHEVMRGLRQLEERLARLENHPAGSGRPPPAPPLSDELPFEDAP